MRDTVFYWLFLVTTLVIISCDVPEARNSLPAPETLESMALEKCGGIPQELLEWPVDRPGCPICEDQSFFTCCEKQAYFCRCIETTYWHWGKFFCSPSFNRDAGCEKD